MMTPRLFARRVAAIPIGKRIGKVLWVHLEEFKQLELHELALLLRMAPTKANLLKLDPKRYSMSFLSYPHFESDHWPALTYGIFADLHKGELSTTKFSRDNPPILHRKELLWPSHPDAPAWAELTKRCEAAGCFREVVSIGTRDGWLKRLRECNATGEDVELWVTTQRERIDALHRPRISVEA